jgi:putative hemolysin
VNVDLQLSVGRFRLKTAETRLERQQAFRLRYQVFQVEMVGLQQSENEDTDEFDEFADHLLIYDEKNNLLIATCRLNSSLFSKKFYTEQEFDCSNLMARSEIQLEIGRVCVHRDFRKGIVLILLWRAIAQYILKTNTDLLFGCGSVMTTDPHDAAIIYKYLIEENKVRPIFGVNPRPDFSDEHFQSQFNLLEHGLNPSDRAQAKSLLPAICKSYFDIGCFVPGPPAFDREFKCIDFLTVLDVKELDPKVRKKMMGLDA